ncbi:hypothetical protein NM963_20725 [Agrobacterium tumefaciens]|nr:hypothetical protein [Agrobacterium tumefaciens]MCW8146244.1 hypothetical protein [Agrobacterium tumefaciens]
MSGLKAMVKRVSDTWSRSPQIDSPPRAEYAPPAPPVADQGQNISKPQVEAKHQQPVAEPIKLEYADKIPQAYVPHEENQERLRGQLRGKMQTLDEQQAARKEAAAVAAALAKVKEIRPSGEIIYKGAPSLSPGDTIHPGKRPPPPQSRTPSVDAGVPPLPSPADAYQTVQTSSIRAHEVRVVDIPSSTKSENPRLSRTPSASTISSTASSVFSSTSKSSVETTASSVAGAPPPLSSAVNASRMAQAPEKSIKPREVQTVGIPSSNRPEDARTRPTDLSRAEDHQTNQRRQLSENIRSRSNGIGR